MVPIIAMYILLESLVTQSRVKVLVAGGKNALMDFFHTVGAGGQEI